MFQSRNRESYRFKNKDNGFRRRANMFQSRNRESYRFKAICAASEINPSR